MHKAPLHDFLNAAAKVRNIFNKSLKYHYILFDRHYLHLFDLRLIIQAKMKKIVVLRAGIAGDTASLQLKHKLSGNHQVDGMYTTNRIKCTFYVQ